MRKTVLVTGATGLLGQALVIEALAAYDVVAVVHQRRLDLDGLRQVRGDLRDIPALVRLVDGESPDIVVNCAALVRPDDCHGNPDLAESMNTAVPEALARWSADAGARFVQISTDAVYGDAAHPFTEQTAPMPHGVYARTKLAGERAVLQLNPGALVARTNFFGWSGSGDRSLAEFFLTRLREGVVVPGFTDVEFTPLYNRDLAALLLRAVQGDLQGVRNFGSLSPLSKYEFGRTIAEEFGLDPALVKPASRQDAGLQAPRGAYLTMDSSKLAAELGVVLPTAQQGIARMKVDEEDGFALRLARQTQTQDD